MITANDCEMKVKVMEACINVFNEKGLKFTMDDVAKSCHISKKTLYLLFDDKEALFLEMVDYLFDGIKDQEEKVRNSDLSIPEKLKKILGVMPESYANIEFAQLYSLKDKYPTIYDQVEKRLEGGWETTIEILEQGIKEGSIRPVNITLVKMMFEATLEQFFSRDILVRNGLSYAEALKEVVSVITDGIVSTEKQ